MEMFQSVLKMEKLIFLLMITIKLTEQTQPVCTHFGLATPRATDLRKIAWEVQKIQAKNGIPVLADYSEIPNSLEIVNRDFSCYVEGMNNPEDARLTIAQLVQKYGFAFEQYNNVKTEDGYYLTLHRIPNVGGDVVFLNHGLLGSSINWLMAGQDSLPFILATLGYDVWLGNFRGNTYSTTHESLTPDCAQYWDFSYEEHGIYDLPASIDFITYKTGQRKIFFIGHSLSCTAFLVMASLRQEYNNRIKSMVAIAPMAWSTHVRSPILKLFAATENMDRILKSGLGPFEFRPSDLLTDALRTVMCANNPIAQVLCSQTSFLITGFNEKCLNLRNLYTISQHYPSGGSTKTLFHYSQNVVSGQFRRFDYSDLNVNIDRYESLNPTEYPLGNVVAKVSILLSYSDNLSNVTDVLKLTEHLSNVGDLVYIDDYSNIDYLWGTNAKEQVYDKIVGLIQKY